MVDGETIERILEQHRGDLQTAGKALIHAANRGGGEDNITAVLFELADGAPAPPPAAEPDETTREHGAPPEDEDTLHPEDGVRLPPAADTMIIPAQALQPVPAERGARSPQRRQPPRQELAGGSSRSS